MSFCQRHNFQVDKVPLENGGWIGGRQNLWLIASLMWQGPAVWGNWSALRVDTFCVSLSCRLLLAWPWGPRARQFTLQTLRGQHQLFYCGYWLVPAAPLWLICLLTSAWSVPASILSLSTPSSPHTVSSDIYFKPSFLFSSLFLSSPIHGAYLLNNYFLSCHLINTASLLLLPGIKHELNTNQA